MSLGKSIIEVEWTNQHGCGIETLDESSNKQNCQLVLQYMCQPKLDYDKNNSDRIRDGLTTDDSAYTPVIPNIDEDQIDYFNRKKKDTDLNRGLHETWQYYDACVNRERNHGLFTADQVLKKNLKGYSGSIYTRQNPNGNQI